MSAEENSAVARRFFEEFATGRKAEIAPEIMTEDHVYHDPQVPGGNGRQAMVDIIGLYQTAVEGHWQIEQMVAQGDFVAVRWTGSGRQTGEVMGIPPTGKSVRVDAQSVLRFRDGKIAEHWAVWDTLGFLQQLGVVPAPQQAPA